MPNLKDIKRRIGSVKNTQKITHAMKLVSAAKFARANQAVLAARPYARAFDEMCQKVVAQAGEKAQNELTSARGNFKKNLLVVVSSDRGLCGSLNSNLLKLAAKYVRERQAEGIQVDVYTWGRRASSFGRKMKWTVVGEKEKVSEKPKYDGAKTLAKELISDFVTKDYDKVDIVFVEFKSALSQLPTTKQLLPVRPFEATNPEQSDSSVDAATILEPSAEEFVNAIIRRQVEGTVFRTLLESAASEHGARMTAMDSATKNAKEVIRKLTLQYNRGRQAAITKELIEITSGAEAL